MLWKTDHGVLEQFSTSWTSNVEVSKVCFYKYFCLCREVYLIRSVITFEGDLKKNNRSVVSLLIFTSLFCGLRDFDTKDSLSPIFLGGV